MSATWGEERHTVPPPGLPSRRPGAELPRGALLAFDLFLLAMTLLVLAVAAGWSR